MLIVAGRGDRLLRFPARPRRGPGLLGQDHGRAAPAGPARPSTTRSSRSPSASSASSRRRRVSITCRSYTTPGQHHDLRQPEGRGDRRGTSQTSGTRFAKRLPTSPSRRLPPRRRRSRFFNDEFGDTYGIIYGFTADGFSGHRELGAMTWRKTRSRLLQVPDVSKIDDGRRPGREGLPRVLDRAARRARPRPCCPRRGASGAERGAPLRAVVQTGNEKLLLRVSGAFRSEHDICWRSTSWSSGRVIRLGDIATVRRGLWRSAATDVPGQRRARHRDRDFHARRRRRAGARPQHRGAPWPRSEADLPIGIEPVLVADQPVTVEHAINEFMKTRCGRPIAIVAGDQLPQPRPAGRRGGGAVDPADARHGVHDRWTYAGIDLQRISLGALIIALGLLVDDAMITVDDDDHAGSQQGDYQGGRRHLRLSHWWRFRCCHLGHRGGFHPHRLCPQLRRVVHLLDLRRGRHRARRIVVRRRPVSAPLLGP